MTTKRTPRERAPRDRIPPEAIPVFRRMQALEAQCTCEPIDWEGQYWKREECRACEKWWAEHSVLHDLLKLYPWQWPAIVDPDYTGDPKNRAYPPPNFEAQQRYRDLATLAEAKEKGAA